MATVKEKVSQFVNAKLQNFRNAISPTNYGGFVNQKVIQPLANYQTSKIGQSHIRAGQDVSKILFKNPVEMGSQATYDLSELMQGRKPQNQMGQLKRILSTGSFITGAGNPLTALGYTGIGGTLNLGVNLLSGQKPKQALENTAASTIELLPKAMQMAGISKYTNPAIDKAGLLGRGFIGRNLVKMPLNVGEGLLMDKATGYETTPTSIALDALLPLAGDSLKTGKFLAKVRKIDPEKMVVVDPKRPEWKVNVKYLSPIADTKIHSPVNDFMRNVNEDVIITRKFLKENPEYKFLSDLLNKPPAKTSSGKLNLGAEVNPLGKTKGEAGKLGKLEANLKPLDVPQEVSSLDRSLAQQKLNDLMTYTNRLVNEKGLSPQQAQRIGYKEGMAILEGRATPQTQMQKNIPTQEKLLQGKPSQALSTGRQLQGSGRPLSTQSNIQVKGTTPILAQSKAGGPTSTTFQKAGMGQQVNTGLSKSYQNDPLLERIVRQSTNVKNKVGALDYLRTPDRVLKKIGLGYEADMLRKSHNKYIKELPEELNEITNLYKQVPDEQSAISIFKWLDGQAVGLKPKQLEVANKIKSYLSGWADRLELPQDKRITNYITHIFDEQLIKKEFDDDLAKLIQDKVAGSVYDPFTQQRLGKMGYKENVWDALDAYVKRAVRKVNMDPALEKVKKASENLETSQYDYVKSYIDRVNMRPTKTDNLLDNSIKQIIGYKQGARPVAKLTRKVRQVLYRGTLGLNLGSALRNLTQGVNTYAKLGEKYTVLGYTKLLTNGAEELKRVGALNDNMIEDRSLNATKKVWENIDKGLFSFFELAEKINRGSAYYGAKAKALSQGLSEEQAIEAGLKMVRDTQFTFGKIDTPIALQSDLAKLLTQFQSYNIKQLEFMGELVKSKDMAGIVRYGVGSLAVLLTIGELLGMEPKDLIPSLRIGASSSIKGMVVPPAFNPAVEAGKIAITGKDKYGKDLSPEQRIKGTLNELIPYVPGGVQIKKTVGGIGDVARGYAQTASGNVKYPVAQNPTNAVRGALFGGYVLPEAQQNRKDDVAPLSPKQSQSFIESGKKQSTYDIIIQRRMQTALETKIKAVAKQVKEGEITPEEGRKQMRVIVDEKTIYESSSDAPKNIVSKVALYGQSLIADPSFTFEAVVEGNPLRKMSGDATVLERQKYLGTLDAGNKTTEVDHIIPLSLGGTNQDSNLQFLLAEENALKASYELELLSQLKSGMINKEQAQTLIRDWRNHVDLSLLPTIAEELEKQTKTTKTKTKTTKAKKGKKLKAAKAPKFKKFKSSKIKLAKPKIKSLKNYAYLPKLKAPTGVSEKTLESLRHPRV